MTTPNDKLVQAKRTLRDELNSEPLKLELAKVLPSHITPDRMVRVALTATLKSPALLDCTRESVFSCLLICAQAGLEPDGRLAHLVPFGKTCQVIFDYKGIVTLGLRNGLDAVYADMVCEHDEFDARVIDGIKKINHSVNWKKPRGAAYAYYAVTQRKGIIDFEIMTVDEVKRIKARSRAGNNGPWITDEPEMSKKTVLRRMSKRWDLIPEIGALINADFDTPEFEPTVQTSRPIFKTEAIDVPTEPVTETPPPAPEPEPIKSEAAFKSLLKKRMAEKNLTEEQLLSFLFTIGLIDNTVTTIDKMGEQTTQTCLRNIDDFARRIEEEGGQ